MLVSTRSAFAVDLRRCGCVSRRSVGAEPARLGQVCFNYVLFNHLLACGWALLAFAEGFDASWVRLLPAPYILNHDLSKHGGKWER